MSLTLGDDPREESDDSSTDSGFSACCVWIVSAFLLGARPRAVLSRGAEGSFDGTGDWPDEARVRPDRALVLAVSVGAERDVEAV